MGNTHRKDSMHATAAVASGSLPATFAAGCFWGTERYFKKQFKGCFSACRVGYMGGTVEAPTYKDVCSGTTGHAEVLHLTYDPTKVSYDDLVAFFFRMHNPTTLNRQGNDKGTQYRSAIFVHSREQEEIAKRWIAELNSNSSFREKIAAAFGPDAKVVTTVEQASSFYEAEEYHQAYLDENPNGYCNHRIYW